MVTNNYFHKTQAQTAEQSSCLYTVPKKTWQNNHYLKPPHSLYALKLKLTKQAFSFTFLIIQTEVKAKKKKKKNSKPSK